MIIHYILIKSAVQKQTEQSKYNLMNRYPIFNNKYRALYLVTTKCELTPLFGEFPRAKSLGFSALPREFRAIRA